MAQRYQNKRSVPALDQFLFLLRFGSPNEEVPIRCASGNLEKLIKLQNPSLAAGVALGPWYYVGSSPFAF
jgi:hypothetical protein